MGIRRSRRPAWALPPHPPETWVGGIWLTFLVIGVAAAVFVPIAPVWHGAENRTTGLADARAASGAASFILAFALLVQSTVSGDRRLRWTAGGYAFAYALILARGHSGASVVEGLAVLTLAAVPLAALTSPLERRGLALLAVPAVALAAAAGAVLVTEPALVVDEAISTTARAAWAGVAVLSAIAAAFWLRPGTSSRRWVGGSLALGTVACVLHAAAQQRFDNLWWAGRICEAAAFVIPALIVGAQTARGYGRQSRRWRQLEAEVKALRRGSRLLPNRSVTPEDDEGLPGEGDVQTIVDTGAVRVALQPVISLPSGEIVGSEALSRFGGRIPTDRWFKAANKCGLGGALERLCLRAALTLLPSLPAGHFLAVNISPAALSDAEVIDMLHAADLRRVVVEITEHEAVEDYAMTRTVLSRLRAAGARIAVDDTGAGFASLRHVLMLQPDVIKLDIGLTRDVDVDRRQQALVRAVTAFSTQVGAIVLAEGVETQAQLETLRDIGVGLGQGWHLGVPVLVT